MVEQPRPPLSLRPYQWVWIDRVAAVVLAMLYMALTKKSQEDFHGVVRVILYPAAFVTPLPVAIRRSRPVHALVLVLAGYAVMITMGTVRDPFLMPLCLTLYMVAVRLPGERAVPALGVSVGTFVVVSEAALHLVGGPVQREVNGPRIVQAIGVVVAVWTIGVAVRQRRAYTVGLQEQAERRGRAQVAEERLRIARELHDIVAHSMSLIAVQASVANYVTAQRGGGEDMAARVLVSIEETSRSALAEMRRLLGVLRDVDGARRDPDLEPAPDLSDLAGLAARTADAGVRVGLRVLGEAVDLSPAVGLAAYRIVQEALTNVIKHADTDAARVVVAYEDDAVRLEITDEGQGGTPVEGHGITGMRERVGLFGGVFGAGPRLDRGFRVVAVLPLNGAVS